jgi:hypothetical protein
MSSPPKAPPVTPEAILQVGLGFWASKTLLSAIELELFTELALQPGTLAELQTRLGLHPRSARDFLDALVALGFLERRGGTYDNTPATAAFLDKAKPSYIGGMLEMANIRLYGFWNNLTEGLRTGQQQNEARTGGKFLFEELYADRLTATSLAFGLGARLWPWLAGLTLVLFVSDILLRRLRLFETAE